MNTATPMDGHCLLLMEAQKEQRTFSDHPNVELCLDSILAIYEESPGRDEQYTLDIIWKWLDNFNSITLYVFNEELARYKKIKHNELKELFIAAIQRQHNPATKAVQNGISTNKNNHISNNQLEDTPIENGASRSNERSFRNRFSDDRIDDQEEDDWD